VLLRAVYFTFDDVLALWYQDIFDVYDLKAGVSLSGGYFEVVQV
jgi:hypothetical protein